MHCRRKWQERIKKKEENGNPLQCSCLENPRDSGAWWAAVYGVTQSQTQLKQLKQQQQQQGLLEVLHWFPSTYLYLTRKKKKQIKCRNYVVFLKCVHKLFHNPKLKVWRLILFPLSVDQNW